MNGAAPLDSLGMWEATAALPEQLSGASRAANDAFAGLAAGTGASVRSVAAFGLGTGGTACAAAAALTAPDLTVPFWVGRGSALPAFVDESTLVLAVSSSGRTEETLTAAEKAVERGARVVAIGGEPTGALARLARRRAPACPGAPSRPRGRGPGSSGLGGDDRVPSRGVGRGRAAARLDGLRRLRRQRAGPSARRCW